MAVLGITSLAGAQSAPPAADTVTTTLKAVSVTATRRATEVFSVPSPVTVLDANLIQRRSPANLTELFRDYAGLDVVGVGGNQLRPTIRGQRGQRILLLQDGLRLGNTRRQQDFGELPALVDPSSVERIEVVRGPASVLYGTDAIGGVMNLITAAPSAVTSEPTINGQLGYRYGEAGGSNRGEGRVSWQSGGLALEAGGTLRDAGAYRAPSGSYGNVTLDDATRVEDTGVKDRALHALLSWRAPEGQGAFVRAERYRADDAGFGFVDPALIGESVKIQIQYPLQEFNKITAGANTGTLSNPLATRVTFSAYRQTNGRDLSQSIFVPFGPGTPPGAGVDIQTRNHTDVTTIGFRAEAMRAFSRNILTYGADFFRDDAKGRDSSLTTVVGFGPPQSEASTRPQIPNATLSSLGVFAQNDIRVHDRFSLIVGGRYQSTDSKPRATPGSTTVLEGASNSTGVYAVNALFRATPRLNLVATVGRGFRAPNLVERYFDGPTPEGSAYQSATPDLKPERSLNVDVGARFQANPISAEVFLFQNRIEDGIRAAFAGDSVGPLPRYENVNVSALRIRGAEVAVAARLGAGFTADGNWSRFLSRNVSDPALKVGDVYSSKANFSLGWQPSRAWWTGYSLRRNGEQREIVAGTSPVGDVLPAFTVHSLRGGFSLRTRGGLRQDIGLQLNNLTNELYAEIANAGFFRPEPRRNLVLSVTTWF